MDIAFLVIGVALSWCATSYFGPPAGAQRPAEPAREEAPKPPDASGDCIFWVVLGFIFFS